MAATKSVATLESAVAGSTTVTTTSASTNLTTAYGALITGTITNGTAPTVGCTVTCQTSTDNTTFDTYQAMVCPTTASAVTPFVFEVPLNAMYVRMTFSATSVAVTINCRISYTTAI